MTAFIEHDGVIYRRESALRRGLRRLTGSVAVAGATAVVTGARTVLAVARAKATPAVAHVREHAYSIAGFALADAAGFTHSLFTGLLWTAASVFIFEWKVSPEEGTDVTADR